MRAPPDGVRAQVLPTKESIRRGARHALAAHLALGGGAVGATLVVAIARVFHGVADEPAEKLSLGAVVLVSTALLTLVVIDRVLRAPTDVPRRTLVLSLVAAFFNVTLALAFLGLGALVASLLVEPFPGLARLLVALCVGGIVCFVAALPGLLVSLPLGALLGLAYAGVADRLAPDLAEPSHGTVPRALRLGAAFLAASAVVAGGVATALEPDACAGAVVAGTLAVCALGAALAASIRDRRTAALRAALLGDRHPELVLVDRSVAAALTDAAPLGRHRADRAVVPRATLSSAYRGRPIPVAFLG